MLAIPMPCTAAESIALRPRFPVQAALGRCSSQDLAPLYARFVRNDTWVTPTFSGAYEIANWPKHEDAHAGINGVLIEAVMQRIVVRVRRMHVVAERLPDQQIDVRNGCNDGGRIRSDRYRE